VDFRDEVVIASAIAGGNGCYQIDITRIEAGPERGALVNSGGNEVAF
jgi:hypothetical protein